MRFDNRIVAAGVAMIMLEGQVYRCQNPRCCAEVRVEKESIDGFSNPICCCGAEMKKPYGTSSLRKIEPAPEVVDRLERKS